MQTFLCYFCMYKSACLQQKNKQCLFTMPKSQANAGQACIQWINLNPLGSRLKIKKAPQEMEPDQLFVNAYSVAVIDDFALLYAPLFTRIYLVPQSMLEKNSPDLRIKSQFLKSAYEAGLLINAQTYRFLIQSMEKQQADLNTLRITFASGCQLNCSYCYARGDQKNDPIDIEALDRFLQTLKNQNARFKLIEFHGNGEPTFNFKELKAVTKVVRHYYPDTKIFMQSNGQFDESIARWLMLHRINVHFSIDGYKQIQDKQRPHHDRHISSFDNLSRNIELFKKNQHAFAFIITVTQYSVDYLQEIYAAIKLFQPTRIVINPLLESGRAEQTAGQKNSLNSQVDLKKFTHHYIKIMEQALEDRIEISSRLMQSPFKLPGIFKCGAVSGRYIYMPDNSIISCCPDSQYSAADWFYLGQYQDRQFKLDAGKINRLKKRTVLEMTACRDCFVKWSCKGGCLADSYLYQGDIHKIVPGHCQVRKEIMEHFIRSISRKMLAVYAGGEPLGCSLK